MKKVQRDRFNMMLSVESYLNNNSKLFAGNIPLVVSSKILSTKIAELKDQIGLQAVNYKGITINKKELRDSLQNQAFILSSAICSYASATEDRSLYSKAYCSKSALVHLRDLELTGICTLLLREITEHSAELIAYNVTAAMISDFKKALADFSIIAKKPREAIGKKAEATARIQQFLAEIMEVIRQRLDKDMILMERTQPQFVAVYKNLRSIKNSPVHKRSLTVVVRDAETQKPIKGAFLETAKNVQRKTGKKGMTYVAKLPEGKYKLQIVHPDYEPETLRYAVILNNATKLEMLLRPLSSPGGGVPEQNT